VCAHRVESMVARGFDANIAEERRVYLDGG
jgi:hypothetical protein